MKLLKLYNRRQHGRLDGAGTGNDAGHLDHENHFFSETSFNELLLLERRRTERTKRPICLMLFDVEQLFASLPVATHHEFIHVLAASVRDIDVCGWHKYRASIGIIFTALDEGGLEASIDLIRAKIREKLLAAFSCEIVGMISISCHIFPEEHDVRKPEDFINSKFYPEAEEGTSTRFSDVAKRVMDVFGGLAGLLLFSPFFSGDPPAYQNNVRRPRAVSSGADRAIRQEVYLSQIPVHVPEQRRPHPSRVHQAAHGWQELRKRRG